MAKFLFFADLPNGEMAMTVDRADYDMGDGKMPRIWTEATGWVRCTRVVQRKSNPSMHKCDTRCMFAQGRTMNCECACGGKNHGKGNIVCEAA